ncbi:MAG: hypothetical protein RL338_414 [Chloroflexota bacterium]
MTEPDPTGGSAPPVVGQARDLPLDAHLHTDRSSDSRVPIDVYAAAAVARGIREIAITDHIDFSPGLPNLAPDVGAREREVREAAERWGPLGVEIRFGVEVSFEAHREAEIREHLARTPYDYAIGSVHVGPDSPYHASRVERWVDGRRIDEIVAPYFAEVERAIRSGCFDTVGHLDFVKRYLVPLVPTAALAAAPELYEPMLRALVETGTALEVNVSGLRQRAAETYPSPAIVARFRELGGTRIVTGSDAHLADSFAWGLEEGYRAVAEAGFEELAFRRRPGGDRVAVALPPRYGGPAARWS